jgi:apolipoprotein D and lipocalin family protein
MTTLLSLLGCASDTYHKTVDKIEINRFMRKWYVIAGRFTPLEKDVYNSIEEYTWNEKENKIEIDFRYNRGGFNGELKKIPQTGKIENTKTNAHWKIKPGNFPFSLFTFDYLIVGLSEDYEWTAIGVPSEKYLWIMSPNPAFPKTKIPEILEKLKASGYNTADIVYVEHDGKH